MFYGRGTSSQSLLSEIWGKLIRQNNSLVDQTVRRKAGISSSIACGFRKSFDLEFEEDWVLEETVAVLLEVNNCVDENKVIWRFFIKLSSVLDYNF
jgi:hypothetical protein